MVITQTIPQHSQTETLSIIHIALGRIVAQNAIDHDLFFALVEPAVFAAEAGCCLRWGGREVEPGYYADEAGEHAFEGKEPAL